MVGSGYDGPTVTFFFVKKLKRTQSLNKSLASSITTGIIISVLRGVPLPFMFHSLSSRDVGFTQGRPK